MAELGPCPPSHLEYSGGEKRNSCLDLLARQPARSFDISELQKYWNELSGSLAYEETEAQGGEDCPKAQTPGSGQCLSSDSQFGLCVL